MRKRTDEKTARLVVDSLGGTCAVANICEIKAPSVSGWLRNGIPEGRLLFLQQKFRKVKAVKEATASVSGK